MSHALVDLDGIDDTPAVQALFVNLKATLPELEKLLQQASGEWGYEDPIYRVYHQSSERTRSRSCAVHEEGLAVEDDAVGGGVAS